MPARSIRPDATNAAAQPGPDPAASRTPSADGDEKRRFRLQTWIWGKLFADRLAGNALWIKHFLHDAK